MSTVAAVFGAITDALLGLFGWLSLGNSLVLISLLLGVGMLYVFRGVGDGQALEDGVRRMQAHIMEMRLFDREPKLVFQAIGRLFYWNFRFMFATLKPMVIATIPMLFLFFQLEHYYGVRPLKPGESTTVTVQLNDPAPLTANQVSLSSTDEDVVVVETAPLRQPVQGRVRWRIRGISEGRANLRVTTPNAVYDKQVDVSRSPVGRISSRRAVSTADTILHPVERPLPAGVVYWIDIAYPSISVSWLGLSMHWIIWLFIVSLFGSLLVRWLVNRIRPGTL